MNDPILVSARRYCLRINLSNFHSPVPENPSCSINSRQETPPYFPDSEKHDLSPKRWQIFAARSVPLQERYRRTALVLHYTNFEIYVKSFAYVAHLVNNHAPTHARWFSIQCGANWEGC